MEKFTTLTSVAAPLIRPNIDTDAIIPSREIRSVSKSGLADGLFAGWRYLGTDDRKPNPQFVLNTADYRDARILLGGENFGCGSSREHAAWALAEFGFRAVIAPSFNPIFEGNCVRNGIVPVKLPLRDVEHLAADVASAPRSRKITIDLKAQEVRSADGVVRVFALPEESKTMLLFGLDAIDLTLMRQDEIDKFVALDRLARTWNCL